MVSNVQNQIVEYGKRVGDLIDLSNSGDIELEIGAIVNSQMINLGSAMSNLTQVGGYLQLAYAGSKGFSCNTKITGIICDYQRLVNDSALACDKFVESCIFAVRQYMTAIKLAEKTTLVNSMKIIGGCEKVVKEMIATSDQLIEECDGLCSLAREALLEASDNDVSSSKQKKEIEESIAKSKAREASLKSKTKDLSQAIKEERENEQRAASRADAEQQRIYILSIVQTALKPLNIGENLGSALGAFFNPTPISQTQTKEKEEGESRTGKFVKELFKSKNSSKEELIKNQAALELKKKELQKMKKKDSDSKEKDSNSKEKANLKKEIRELELIIEHQLKENEESHQMFKSLIDRSDKREKSYLEQESAAAARRREWQNVQMECNAELARTVSELQSMNKEEDELGKAIKSLQVAISALGKIKTIFENARMYWIAVQERCNQISHIHETINILADSDVKELWIEEIRSNQRSWFYLGGLNFLALKAIAPAKERMDAIMSDLPSGEVAKKIVEPFCGALLLELEAEKKLLEAPEGKEKEKEK